MRFLKSILAPIFRNLSLNRIEPYNLRIVIKPKECRATIEFKLSYNQ